MRIDIPVSISTNISQEGKSLPNDDIYIVLLQYVDQIPQKSLGFT